MKTEDDPVDPMVGTPAESVMGAIRHLEHAVDGAGGAVLRYGWIYGPGANDDLVETVRRPQLPLIGNGDGCCSWLHIDDAVEATFRAIEQRASGVFNVVDDEPAPARGWLPHLATSVGAKPPMRLLGWVAGFLAGDVPVVIVTEGRGFSNDRVKRTLGWEPRYPSWRTGFREALE